MRRSDLAAARARAVATRASGSGMSRAARVQRIAVSIAAGGEDLREGGAVGAHLAEDAFGDGLGRRRDRLVALEVDGEDAVGLDEQAVDAAEDAGAAEGGEGGGDVDLGERAGGEEEGERGVVEDGGDLGEERAGVGDVGEEAGGEGGAVGGGAAVQVLEQAVDGGAARLRLLLGEEEAGLAGQDVRAAEAGGRERRAGRRPGRGGGRRVQSGRGGGATGAAGAPAAGAAGQLCARTRMSPSRVGLAGGAEGEESLADEGVPALAAGAGGVGSGAADDEPGLRRG